VSGKLILTDKYKKNKQICPDYETSVVNRKGKKVEVCSYWDFDNPGLCKHDNHSVCRIYLQKYGFSESDRVVWDLLNEFALTVDDFVEDSK